MSLSTLDPLIDDRWTSFIEGHPEASIFHTRGWLQALHRTYGYAPVVFTTAPRDQPLKNGVVCCRVSSWLTGKRLVSLPFSDHCEPLVQTPDELREILSGIQQCADDSGLKYVELRPRVPIARIDAAAPNFGAGESFALHRIDLAADEDTLFKNLHNDCVRRKVRKAERENIEYESGASDRLLDEFYALTLFTRRKHQLPPQPRAWFRHVRDGLGARARVLIARKNGRAIASLFITSFGNTHYYKYGSSDPEYANLGATPLLFWRAIVEARQSGARWLDLGRSELSNEGLLVFKDRLGAMRSQLTYYRFPAPLAAETNGDWKTAAAKRVFAVLPDRALIAAGTLLYRHMG